MLCSSFSEFSTGKEAICSIYYPWRVFISEWRLRDRSAYNCHYLMRILKPSAINRAKFCKHKTEEWIMVVVCCFVPWRAVLWERSFASVSNGKSMINALSSLDSWHQLRHRVQLTFEFHTTKNVGWCRWCWSTLTIGITWHVALLFCLLAPLCVGYAISIMSEILSLLPR